MKLTFEPGRGLLRGVTLMKPPFSPLASLKFTACVIALLSMSGISAEAWPWNSEPQPLLNDRAAIRADAGSPLAWDRSARVLWFVGGGRLNFAYWNGTTFVPRNLAGIVPQVDAGILVDEAWHLVYFVDANGRLGCARRSNPDATWFSQVIGQEFLKRLLAVDNRTHSVFAYDSITRGIRQYTYEAKTKTWASSIIASGLGSAGDTAAWDSGLRVLYSSHETADDTVPRPAGTHRDIDPTGIGGWQPWPLVATAWDGEKWSSRVLDETGVPQLPAVRATDHTVFFARRDELNVVRTFRPAANSRPDFFGSVSGWSGADTYEDHDKYKIKLPQYPDAWKNFSSSFSMADFRATFTVTPSLFPFQIQLKGPITVVPYYKPVWTDTMLPARLAHFRAVVNPRQNRLVQHRQIFEGERVREQTGKRIAGYLYRDVNGVLAVRGKSTGGIVFSTELPGEVRTYPSLDNTFDPANPPAEFSALADPNVRFFASVEDTSLISVTNDFWGGGTVGAGVSIPLREISTTATTDANAPFVETYLRLPTSVQTKTFGHNYNSFVLDQRGSRYRHYNNFGTSYAQLSSIAGDSPNGVTFYVQSAEPSADENKNTFVEKHSAPPLIGFRPLSDFKMETPSGQSVWIVMVY